MDVTHRGEDWRGGEGEDCLGGEEGGWLEERGGGGEGEEGDLMEVEGGRGIMSYIAPSDALRLATRPWMCGQAQGISASPSPAWAAA